jgi:hypothetical protein
VVAGGPNDTDVCLLRIEPSTAELGWTGERCPYGLRIRRGEVDWKGAEPRRELQGDGQDVSAHPGTDSAGKSFEIEGRQTVAHAQEPATRAAQRDESRLQEALTHAPL